MTAETAVALPALVLVLTASLWAVAATDAQLRCVDAARAGARAAARGEAPEQVRAVVLRLAPADTTVSVAAGAGTVRVEVTATVRPLWRSFLPPVRLRASAVSDTEPGVLPPPPGSLSATLGPARSMPSTPPRSLGSATLRPARSMPSTPRGSPGPATPALPPLSISSGAPKMSGARTRRERDAGPGEAHGGGRSSPHLDDVGTQERR